MSIVAETQSTISHRSQAGFAIAVGMFVVGALSLTIAAPIALSIAIVFLFAGPHNYVEARYFLTRLPARMGRLRPFFLISATGVISLTITLPLVARFPGWMGWPAQSVLWTIALWNAALVVWCTILVRMRSHQPPRREWDYAWPIGLCVIGVACMQPLLLPLLLVYVHPLMGLWVLDLEISKQRPQWHGVYRVFLWMVLPLVVVIWMAMPDSQWTGRLFEIPSGLQTQISQHVGVGLLPLLHPGKLIATHAFLELLHYGVWLVAIPAASGRVFSKRFREIPLMKVTCPGRRIVQILLMGAASVVVVLWICFTVDYSTTRDIYFTVATLHVLAEVPFLLRLL